MHIPVESLERCLDNPDFNFLLCECYPDAISSTPSDIKAALSIPYGIETSMVNYSESMAGSLMQHINSYFYTTIAMHEASKYYTKILSDNNFPLTVNIQGLSYTLTKASLIATHFKNQPIDSVGSGYCLNIDHKLHCPSLQLILTFCHQGLDDIQLVLSTECSCEREFAQTDTFLMGANVGQSPFGGKPIPTDDIANLQTIIDLIY